MWPTLWADTHPFGELDALRREVHDLFGRRRGFDGLHGLRHASRHAAPRFRIRETDSGWTVTADLPGLATGDLDIEVKGRGITIRGKRTLTEADDGETLALRERRAWSFERKLRFADTLDPDAIDAHLEHGVLTLTIARSEAATSRRIEVSGA